MKKKQEKKEGLTFYNAIMGFYNHKDKKFLEDASKLVSPYILLQWLSNDVNMLELVSALDKYTGIKKDIFLALAYYLIPKRNKSPYLKYAKSEKKELDKDEVNQIINYLEISKSEFDKYYRKHLI